MRRADLERISNRTPTEIKLEWFLPGPRSPDVVLTAIGHSPRTVLDVARLLHCKPGQVVDSLLSLVADGVVRRYERNFGSGCTGSVFVIMETNRRYEAEAPTP